MARSVKGVVLMLLCAAWIVLSGRVRAQDEGPSAMQAMSTMKIIVPQLKTVGVLCNSEKNDALLKKIQKGAAILQCTIVLIDIRSMSDYSSQYRSAVSKHQIDFLWVPAMDDNILGTFGKEFLFRNSVLDRVPLMVPSPDLAAAGGLCALKVSDGKLEIILNKKLSQFYQITIPEAYAEKVKYVAN